MLIYVYIYDAMMEMRYTRSWERELVHDTEEGERKWILEPRVGDTGGVDPKRVDLPVGICERSGVLVDDW